VPSESSDRAFDLIVLADLCPGRDAPLAPRRVDRDSLAELQQSLAPSVRIAGAEIAFGDFKAFRPESLAAAIPLTRGLLELRRRLRTAPPPSADELARALESLPEGSADIAALKRALAGDAGPSPSPTLAAAPAPAPARPASGGGDPLDAIFGMVETGGAAATAPAAESTQLLDRLVRSFAGLSRGPGAIPSASLRALEQAVDEAMSGTLRAALRDPALTAIESAWMGLRFLVRRMDFRSGVRLHVIPCPRARLVAAVQDGLAPFAAEQRRESRAIVAIVDFAFGLDDMDTLDQLARKSEQARVPLIANASAGLLGLGALAALDGIDNATDTLTDEAHAGWSALRDEESARWLALVVNRMLMRSPYGAELERVRDFAFEENPIGADAHYLWGGGAWALAARIAASVEQSGWGVDAAGAGEDHTVDDLPVRPLKLKTGETVQCPLEALLSEKRALELSLGGLVPLACRRNSDHAFAPTAPVVRRPGERDRRPEPDETRRATLAYTLYLSQVTAQIEHLAAWVDRSRPPAEIARALAQALEILNTVHEGATLGVSAGEAEGDLVALVIRAQLPPLRGLPDLRLEIPLS
jgi:type VI secretion system protein ImpC